MAEVVSSMLSGVTFCSWIFLFSRSKAYDANVDIFVNSVCSWKTLIGLSYFIFRQIWQNVTNLASVESFRPLFKGQLLKLLWHAE